MPYTMEELVRKRTSLQRNVVKLQALIVTYNQDTVDPSLLDLDVTRLLELKDKGERLYDATFDLCATDKQFTDDHETDFDVILMSIKNLQVKVMSMIRKLKEKKSDALSPSFKLERIKLPQFSGNFSEWQSFRDLFIASVHKNKTLSGAEKIIHLKTCLHGEAASIVSSFQTTEDNYKEAWECVLKRYNVKREIVFAHIKKFDELKPLKEESSSGLRLLADTVNECIRSLKVLEVPVETWDLILIYIALKKLDSETRKEWSLKQEDELPTLSQFIMFIESRARALQDAKPSASGKPVALPPAKSSLSSYPKKTSSSHATRQSQLVCAKCAKSHHLHQCKDFASLSSADRRSFVLNNRLCFNCMFKGHSSMQCPVKFACKSCRAKHHTMLHEDSPHAVEGSGEAAATTSFNTASAFSNTKSETVALLATLLVSVPDSRGQKQVCRVFMDSGSESNFITEGCVQRLGLKRQKACVTVSGIGGVAGESAKGLVNLQLHSHTTSFAIDISALIYRKLTNNLIPRQLCKSSWPHLKGLELSDPNFHVPSRIDILLGVADSGTILLPGLIQGPAGSPVAQLTQFGWTLSGSVDCDQSSHGMSSSSSSVQVSSSHALCRTDTECLQDSLERFWELEEIESTSRALSSEDELCEQHFASTYNRAKDGSYTVQLPFRDADSVLGSSRAAAVKRLLRLESRLSTNPAVRAEYVKCIREGIESSFIEQIPVSELQNPASQCYYLPHREVVKESSTSTKVRIVYDASAKSDNGLSLNDILMTGPKLQADLVPLLIRFRSHLVAMSADIEKFYPQFKVDKNHTDFQRFVWRESPGEELRDYRLLRVTFGVTSAPFLAIRCLHQLADDEASSHPSAHRVIKDDFLVDNLLSGSDNLDSALELKREILSVMERGQLKLTKLSSNSHKLMQSLPPALRELNSSLAIDDSEIIRTIGLLWQPGPDIFSVSISVPDISAGSSKRRVLSSVARIFDPLGWLSPVTIRPKMLMQELWKLRQDWDSDIPTALRKDWEFYCQELPTLCAFKIDRCIIASSSNSSLFELHGFCDASKSAYSACVYLRTINEDGYCHVKLVVAKAKVAPVKTQTIPRLELCGAVLLAKLMKVVLDSLHLQFSTTQCWTDSMIVLGWLNTKDKLPVFQLNRVRQIENHIPGVTWSHVPGADNPADLATRGLSAASFIKNQLWLHGPEWLLTLPCLNVSTLVATAAEPAFCGIIHDVSSFTKMKRIAAFCLRFINNCQGKRQLTGKLSAVELELGLHHLIKAVQAEAFSEEIQRCTRKQLVKSKVKFLCPFLDEKGILRVGGRLHHASEQFRSQHPVLLPSKHNFVNQLVRSLHLMHLHAGPQLLLALTREQYWIVRGLDAVKRIVHQCVVCQRYNPATATQLMGQLPPSRVRPSRPFSQCGVDYAGPFMLCLRPGRNPITRKAYVSLFICMATRAVHLELVEDLSTAAFIGALTRFISRRGLPAHIFSDGGTNFVGASNETKAVQSFLQSDSHNGLLADFLASKGVQFHFNPPAAPHHGGLWEAGVKSMKHHLRRVIGERKLSLEEFSTLLAQVEACLNSRPLAAMSSDPSDYEVLTPGHFLVGSSLHALPQHDLTHLSVNRLSRWQAVQQMLQHFWRRWSSEYVATLQSRPKWFYTTPNLEAGMLVLVRDSEASFSPLKWNLGRIAAIHRGVDGLIRVCEVRMPNGSVLKRPIVKLSPLCIYSDLGNDLLVSADTKGRENVQKRLP